LVFFKQRVLGVALRLKPEHFPLGLLVNRQHLLCLRFLKSERVELSLAARHPAKADLALLNYKPAGCLFELLELLLLLLHVLLPFLVLHLNPLSLLLNHLLLLNQPLLLLQKFLLFVICYLVVHLLPLLDRLLLEWLGQAGLAGLVECLRAASLGRSAHKHLRHLYFLRLLIEQPRRLPF
jgi:hypothetical protein